MFADFYSTFAAISLTVTGLWMVVAQARFQEWINDPDDIRRASAVSVQLAFPGIMCLFALVDPESSMLWRVSFGVISVLAFVLLLSLARRSTTRWGRANAIGNWLAATIFAGIAVVAVVPDIVADLGIGMVARRVEFLLFCLLIMNGIVVAWLMLFAEAHDDAVKEGRAG